MDATVIIAIAGFTATVLVGGAAAWANWRTNKNQIKARASELTLQLNSERERDERSSRIESRIDDLGQLKSVVSEWAESVRTAGIALATLTASRSESDQQTDKNSKRLDDLLVAGMLSREKH